ncbi:MAG TPA: universal stress protein [Noviherbaspirillum sp.]|nr:universal stress protein [Noviherbaspirillum sp.]
MFKKFLVPTDGSTQSAKAVQGAIQLAGQVGGSLVALAVVEPYPFPAISESPYAGGSAAYEERALDLAKDHVEQVAAAAAKAGIPCETVVLHGLYPHEEIVAAALGRSCDAILMGTHGRRGISRLFAGSETQSVIGQSPIPVMVFR